jgi:cell division transport system ATP-binding protein
VNLQDDEAIVQFENVGLRYGLGPEVLRDVNFSLNSGSFHFLIGESGAGKSSLLKLIYLAFKPSRGVISLFGRDIATTARHDLPALRRKVGVVFQEFRLLNHLSTFDNVALPLRVAGTRESDVRKHVSELLAWVGLKDHMQARPPTLSGGQQQRVSIARAIIGRPQLLLADEPTGNVDDEMGFRLMHLFEELNKLGTSVVIATHNMHLVERLGHRQLRLDDGQLSVREATRRATSERRSTRATETKSTTHQSPQQTNDKSAIDEKYKGNNDTFGDPSSLESFL